MAISVLGVTQGVPRAIPLPCTILFLSVRAVDIVRTIFKLYVEPVMTSFTDRIQESLGNNTKGGVRMADTDIDRTNIIMWQVFCIMMLVFFFRCNTAVKPPTTIKQELNQ